MTNPAETLWLPVWDNMEYQKQLKIAARQLQAMYGPQAYAGGKGPIDMVEGDLMLLGAVAKLNEVPK